MSFGGLRELYLRRCVNGDAGRNVGDCLVRFNVSRHETVTRVLLGYVGVGAFCKRVTESLVAVEPDHCGCELLGIVGVHEESGGTVADKLWDPQHSRGDDGFPARHRLHKYQPLCLFTSGMDEEFRVRIESEDSLMRDTSGKDNAVLNVQFFGERR